MLDVGDLSATISIGAERHVVIGDEVMFVGEPRFDGASQWTDEKAPQVVGEVIQVARDRALVALGLLESDQLALEQTVEVTSDRISNRRMAPPKTPSTLIMEGGIRPFLPIKRVSIGAVADLAVTYLPPIAMFVRAEISPLAGRVGAGSDMGAWAGAVTVGYDQRYLAIGLGLGAVGFRSEVRVPDYYSHLGGLTPRLQLSQLLRAGARDGLHLSIKPAFALVDDRWRLASLTVAGQLPVATRASITPRFVIAPQSGIFTAELGVRTLVHGNGGHDSLFLRPVVGVAGSFDAEQNLYGSSDSAVSGMDTLLYGPMVGLDVEWRN